jgi:hypothetical protein
MSLEVFEFDVEDKASLPERVIGYSRPGVGKTRWATSLPETPKWGDIVYYAADPGSEYLASVLPHYVRNKDGSKRIHIIRPRSDHNPIVNFHEFCMRDWNKEPGMERVRTLIVDTYTRVAFSSMQWAANSGAQSAEKRFSVGGVKTEDGGQMIPSRQDYMGIASTSRGFIDNLFGAQHDKNIIFLMHEDTDVIEGVGARIGPSHPGRQMADELPANFPTVVRLDRKMIAVPNAAPKSVVVALTNSGGSFVAKIRENGAVGNPMPEVVLDNDPVNFWREFEKTMGVASRVVDAPVNGAIVPVG